MNTTKVKTLAIIAVLCLSTILSVVFGTQTFAASSNVELQINVNTALSMTIHSNGDNDKTYAVYDPEDATNFGSFDMNNYIPFGTSSAKTHMLPNTKSEEMTSVVTVYTNSADGYTLTVSDTDGDTSLVSGENTIPTGAKIEPGTAAWGIKGGMLANYSFMTPVTTQTKVKVLNTKTTGGDSTTFIYGVSTGVDQPTGVYQDTIVYTVTANEPINTTYMQDFDASKMLPNVNDTMLVIDKRDNKTYTAARLADGRVWMTQNLALDIDATKTYTPADTDLAENWKPSRSSIASDNLTAKTWVNDYYRPYSYSSGNPTLGNYYNWSAAVAMNNSSNLTSGYATTSICPKGWTLPQREDYVNLSAAYGLPTENEDSTTAYQVLEADPLNFTRAGYVYDGILSKYSGYGYYWTSTVKNKSYAYRLDYSDSIYYPENSNGRRGGFTVRCMARE